MIAAIYGLLTRNRQRQSYACPRYDLVFLDDKERSAP
jgi:hypothetical protein